MSLTNPYRQHNYMGEYANDAAALVFIQANKWDSNGDGTGTPINGMWYYNTTSHGFFGYQSGSWGSFGGVTDHGALTGLGDDDHTQYILAAGTRAFTGDQSMGTNKLTSLGTPTAATDAATKEYVDQHRDWQESVLDKDLTTPPGSPSAGDRYIVASVGTGAWAGHDDEITQWNGAAWTFVVPNEGTTVRVEDENKFYVFDGASWGLWDAAVDHGELLGLGDDDHSQYHNDTRGDARYRTQSELSSTTGGSEGADLIGTDTKANLNNATTVEVALTELNTRNPSPRTTGAGNPNAGGGLAGAVGDDYYDTTNDIPYTNMTGTNTGWMVK